MTPRTRFYAQQIAAHRCVDCTAEIPAGATGVRCPGHAEAARIRERDRRRRSNQADASKAQRERRARLRAQQLCPTCGSARDDDHVLCSICRRDARLRAAGVTRIAAGPRKPTMRASKYRKLVQHRVLSPPAPQQPPPGWTLEADLREELLALSELVALRKVG